MRTPSIRFLPLIAFATLGAACETRSLVVTDGATDSSDIATSDIAADTANDVAVNDARDGSLEDVTDVAIADASDAANVEDADASDDVPSTADATDAIDDVIAPLDAMDASDDAPDVAVVDDSGDAISSGWTPLGSGSCNARQRAVPVQDAIHVDYDASISWLTNPPSSGPHYSIWAHWGTWPDIPPGYWVHNLEHSGVVFLHSCVAGTSACDATIAALSAAVDTIPNDPVCMPSDADPTRVRVVVTHYEPLDTPIAGAAWGWLYAADCVDPESMRLFYAMHAGMTYENFCSDGYYP